MDIQSIRSVLRNSSYLVTSHGITTALHLIYVVILARLLTPNLYGLLNFGFSWYLLFIALTYLGLDVVLGREIGRNPSAAPSAVGTTLALRGIAALLTSVLSIAGAFVVELDPAARTLILILTIALCSRAIWLWCTSVFIAFENTKQIFVLELLFRPIEILLVTALLLFLAPRNVLTIGAAHAAIWALQAIIGLVVVRRRFAKIEFKHIATMGKRMLVAGLPGALYTLTIICFMQAPTVLYGQVVGTGDALGHFALALQVVGYLNVIPYLVGAVSLPVLSRSASKNERALRKTVITVMVATPAVGATIGIIGFWLAPAIAVTLFGAAYRETGIILGVAVWLFLPVSLAIGLQQILFSIGRGLWLTTISATTGVIAMTALYAPLTHTMGYRGALLSVGAGMTIWAGGTTIAVFRSNLFAGRNQSAMPS